MAAALLLAALGVLAQASPAAAEPEVIVTARKQRTKPIRDAIGYFERHCFDASRLTGQPSTPRADKDWHPLSAGERAQLGVAGDAPHAFGARLSERQTAVLTLAEAAARQGGQTLVEFRCTLIVVGGDQRQFADCVAAIFRGPGTQKHVGERGGLPAAPGWRQLLWAAIPAIGSADWQVFKARGTSTTWVQVIDPAFYRTAEYVVGDLRMRAEGVPLTALTLIYTRRLRRADGDIAIEGASAPPAR